MIKKYGIANNQLTETDVENPPVWVVVDPSEEEKKRVLENFGVDEHNFTSAFDPEEPSRVEFEPDHIEVIFKGPKNYSSRDQFLFKVASMGLFLFREKLIVVVSEDAGLFSGKYFKHITGIREVFLKLLYNSIFHFMEHLKVINMIADEIERKVAHSMENKYLMNLFTLEKSLVYYLNAINSNGYVIEKLKNNAEKAGFSQRSAEFMDDLIIENNQCGKQAGIYSNILAGLMDARVSVVSNNLNILMKNLNAVLIAIAVPSFFAGVGGMSELTVITGIGDPRVAYPVFLTLMLFLGLLTFLIVRWFEKH